VTEGADGESRAALAAVRALARAGYAPAVTESGRRSFAGASRSCARRVAVPAAETDPEGYARAVRGELASRPYVATFVASDAALLALGAPVRHLLDKASCSELAAAAGIPTPPTEVFASPDELRRAARRLRYPVVVKPALKLSAAQLVASAPALDGALPPHDGRVLVQPLIDGPFSGFGGLMSGGRLVASMRTRYDRMWPQPCGTVAAAETLEPDAALEHRVAHLLQGYEGPFHLDFAGPYLLDVNPRIHATLPLAVRGGANLVAMHCALREGRDVATVQVPAGLRFRWLEGDLRSLWWNARRDASVASTAAALLPRRHTVHSFELLADPLPALRRARYMLERLRNGGAHRSRASAARATSSSGERDTSR
jgi:hypothetical protein